MSHIKFVSIPEKWTVEYLLQELCRIMRWTESDCDKIKMIHIERKTNERKHVRIAFTDDNMVKEIKRKGRRTSDSDVNTLRIADCSVLLEVVSEDTEKFKIQTVKKTKEQDTILIKLKSRDSFTDIIRKLSQKANVKFVYITLNKKNSFIKFLNNKYLNEAISYLKREKYEWRYAETTLILENRADKNVRQVAFAKNKKRKIQEASNFPVNNKKAKVDSFKEHEEMIRNMPIPEDVKDQISKVSLLLAKAVVEKERLLKEAKDEQDFMIQFNEFVKRNPNPIPMPPMMMPEMYPFNYYRFPRYPFM